MQERRRRGELNSVGGSILAVLMLAMSLGCNAAREASPPSSASSSASAPVTAVSIVGTPTTSAPSGAGCGDRPPTAFAPDVRFEGLDERSLRGTPSEVRLPAEVAATDAMVEVDGDFVVLEYATQTTYDAAAGRPVYSQADLLLRRFDSSGATEWTLRLGSMVDFYRTFGILALTTDGEVVRVLWPRFDGDLPALLYEPVATTAVVSTVGVDGLVLSQVDVRSIAAQQDSLEALRFAAALTNDGSAAVGEVDGDVFTVTVFDPDGKLRWQDQLSSPAATRQLPLPLLVVLPDGDLVGASGGKLVRWRPDGEHAWELPLEPRSVKPISDLTSGGSMNPAPDLVLGFGLGGEATWFCSLHSDGSLAMRTVEARYPWGEAERSWWTPNGLMILTTLISLGTNSNLVLVAHDGVVRRDINLASTGDVIGPGSQVSDSLTSDDGSVVLLMSLTDRSTDASAADDLESWSALVQLTSPAGTGDLSAVPIRPPLT